MFYKYAKHLGMSTIIAAAKLLMIAQRDPITCHADLTITGNGAFQTSYVSINSSVPSLDFANVSVAFDLPGGVINDVATFSMAAGSADSIDDQRGTSATGPVFNADASAAVPESGTWAGSRPLCSVGGAALARWRKRKSA
jgi:hypothetical protein